MRTETEKTGTIEPLQGQHTSKEWPTSADITNCLWMSLGQWSAPPSCVLCVWDKWWQMIMGTVRDDDSRMTRMTVMLQEVATSDQSCIMQPRSVWVLFLEIVRIICVQNNQSQGLGNAKGKKNREFKFVQIQMLRTCPGFEYVQKLSSRKVHAATGAECAAHGASPMLSWPSPRSSRAASDSSNCRESWRNFSRYLKRRYFQSGTTLLIRL